MINLNQFKNCISIDVETTGVDPERNGILSIGAYSINEEAFYSENVLRIGAEIDPCALKVNGETEQGILKRSAPHYPREWESLVELIRFAKSNNRLVIIGKNPSFDYKMLLAIWKRNRQLERDFPFSYRLIDYSSLALPLMLISGMQVPEKGFSSSDIQSFLGLKEEPKPHNALTGAKYNIYALIKIIEKYNDLKTGISQ